MARSFSVIGLGKLGASMAAAIASRGHQVIGVDINQNAVDLLNAGRAPVQETDLEAYVAANKERLRGTRSHKEAVLGSDVSFVIVPTPSDERGAFSLQYAAWAFKELGRALKEKQGYHLIVLTSTVLPGSTRHGLLPILERESGKKAGKDFGLCYSPEFIALGSVIRDFLHPDFLLVGEFDKRSGDLLEASYKEIVSNGAPSKRMTLENAELAKIAVNTYVTTKMTFANMLADICERIPGGDVDVVTDALGADKRIGRKYLTGAIGYGGPCFPRDNVALSFLAQTLGADASLAQVTDQMNRGLASRVAEWLRHEVPQGATVAVLGLAYKPGSHVIEESQGIYVARSLARTGARVVAYDPQAGESARREVKDQIVVLDSLEACLSQADVVLVTTPDPAFAKLSASDFSGAEKVTVVDFWRILARELEGRPNIRYVPVGRSRDDEAAHDALRGLWSRTAEGAH